MLQHHYYCFMKEVVGRTQNSSTTKKSIMKLILFFPNQDNTNSKHTVFYFHFYFIFRDRGLLFVESFTFLSFLG
jgi:hypothetical protein